MYSRQGAAKRAGREINPLQHREDLSNPLSLEVTEKSHQGHI
jgi:hypothetical protein